MGRGACTYFTDPYCPWSWAAEPHLRRLQVEFGAEVGVTFVIDGLAREITGPGAPAPAALDAADTSALPVDPRMFLRDPRPRRTPPACGRGGRRAGRSRPYLRRLREAILLEGRRMDTGSALLDAAHETGGLQGPRAGAERWRLALECRVQPRRVLGGELWSLAGAC